jgi:protein required for attachment to host cells
MILPNGATVAVVDGRSMLLFQNIGHDPEIDLSPMQHPRMEESHAGSGGRHRSSTANPDAPRLGEDDFAATVSDALNRAVLAGEIVRLLIIADARTLGEMRRHFHKSLQDKLLGEISKDMTGHSKKDIEAAIRAA